MSSLLLASLCAVAAPQTPPQGPADAVVDLTTAAGVATFAAEWRYADARPIEIDFRAVGADGKPSGPPNRTWDIEPRAGDTGFDDAAWQVVDPTELDGRRGAGRLSFAWYRIRLTVPERIGGVPTRGATLVFETVVDDYAEVSVDGALPLELGQRGGPLVAGWNAPNRLVIGRGVTPGQRIQLAVFAANGPLSAPPPNYIWMRSARVELFAMPSAIAPVEVAFRVDRRDPALDEVVPPGTVIERVAEGFVFTEGPVWHAGGLLFSDPNENRIYRWTPDDRLAVFRDPSGYAGADVAEYRQPGSNGLAVDREGRLVFCQHGDHAVARLDAAGELTVLADRDAVGRRLNSPNDVAIKSDGSIWFTDPPFGLPKLFDDPRKEIPYSGVYRLVEGGQPELLCDDLTGPNGIAFAPDERWLYVANWDVERKVVMRYPVVDGVRLGDGEVFFDMTAAPGAEALDGVEVDRAGNLFVSGPGGVWILSPTGVHLGTLSFSELPANFAWGDDGRTLWLAARTGMYRMTRRVEDRH
jgi:gluconolactonase